MSEDDTYLIVAASRYIEKGEQIFNSYGRRSNKFLLVYYGFTHCGNKYDSVGFRFWNEEIYEKTGKLVFVKWLTEKD
jgi:histone-lysine N-methyltransferase SETD3